MRAELSGLWTAIQTASLPPDPNDLFGESYDQATSRFAAQETYIFDYKDVIPKSFSDGYGAGIIRLVIAFFNSFGGIVVFGVNDSDKTVCGINDPINIEALNRTLSDYFGLSIECVWRTYNVNGSLVGTLLVPRRSNIHPATLKKDLDKYRKGTVWIRQRHEVVVAETRHIPLLFSSRNKWPDEEGLPDYTSIQKSLPPSPATVDQFVGRSDLVFSLWNWFVHGDQPRAYLYGPGGSGKSTLAHEFARQVGELGSNIEINGTELVDYVVYLSGKETELNPQTASEQPYLMKTFSNESELFASILKSTGQSEAADADAMTIDQAKFELKQLFSSYNGLIVLDDIDALSRRQVDTGEESLFLLAATAAKKTRILYTLRSQPSFAQKSSMEVPGLSGSEYLDFISACCAQFGVQEPPQEFLDRIAEETSRLPLLIETVIWSRKYFGTYDAVLNSFSQKGGEQARQYLYQREYDLLSPQSKARELIAALSFLPSPISFTSLYSMLEVSSEVIRDAIAAAGNIFLSTSEGQNGETLYQLATPAKHFAKIASQKLNFAPAVERKVQLFLKEGAIFTQEESALIVLLSPRVRAGDWQGIIAIYDSIMADDIRLANPKIRGMFGLAFANSGPKYAASANECCEYAVGMGHHDAVMLRAWFYQQYNSGYGLSKSAEICKIAIGSEKLGPAIKAEFLSKFGLCRLQEAKQLWSVSLEKVIPLLGESATAYLESMEKGSSYHQTVCAPWFEKPLQNLVIAGNGELGFFCTWLESIPQRKDDLSDASVKTIASVLVRMVSTVDRRASKRNVSQLRRAEHLIDRFVRDSDAYPGLSFLAARIAEVRERISKMA